jgi:hypothetical protein
MSIVHLLKRREIAQEKNDAITDDFNHIDENHMVGSLKRGDEKD